MLARISNALVSDLAPIDPVLQHQVEGAAGEMWPPASRPPAPSRRLLHTQSIEFGPEQRDRAQFRIASKDQPDGLGLSLIHGQLAVLDIIAERDVAAHPHALLLRRRDLVADALAGDLALELGEGEQQFSVSRPIEVVVLNCCVTDTKDAFRASKTSTSLAKSQRPGQPVDLVNNDDVNLAGLDIVEKRLRAGRSMVPPEKPPSS